MVTPPSKGMRTNLAGPWRLVTIFLGHYTRHTVTYPGVAGGAPKTITGDVIAMALDREPWAVRLFFAEEHAKIWRAEVR
jgi:hypothetical protein